MPIVCKAHPLATLSVCISKPAEMKNYPTFFIWNYFSLFVTHITEVRRVDMSLWLLFKSPKIPTRPKETRNPMDIRRARASQTKKKAMHDALRLGSYCFVNLWQRQFRPCWSLVKGGRFFVCVCVFRKTISHTGKNQHAWRRFPSSDTPALRQETGHRGARQAS